jgi:hypothetical protein
MRIDIHSHTAPAKYVEAIMRDPKSMGCRIEKDDQGRESMYRRTAARRGCAELDRLSGARASGGRGADRRDR